LSDPGSDSDITDNEGEVPYDEDDYYAFLREMAGSFEANSEEDESEAGSDCGGSSDEEEGDQAVGRKRSSSLSDIDVDPDNGLQAFSQFVGRGRAQGSPEEQEFAKANNSLAGKCMPVLPPQGGYPAKIIACSGGPRQGLQPRVHPNMIAGRFMMTNNAGPLQGAVSSDVSRASSDRRAPVVDDYDVVTATVEFAKQQPTLSRLERQREELLDAIKLRTDQATNLSAVSRKIHEDPEQRSHYARIRLELLAEARTLEDQLKVINEVQQQPAASCSQARAAQAMMIHQEIPFGGHSQAPTLVAQ